MHEEDGSDAIILYNIFVLSSAKKASVAELFPLMGLGSPAKK
jgi:hypothetical protein